MAPCIVTLSLPSMTQFTAVGGLDKEAIMQLTVKTDDFLDQAALTTMALHITGEELTSITHNGQHRNP